MWSRLRGSILFQAVLFSVPFQEKLFSVNGFLKGFLGEVSGRESSKGQGMHMDPSIASLFQAFSLSMQQQQRNDRKEALATKALQAVDFSHALKDEYFLEDADRITKKLFLGWIERPNKNLQATELLREFERQYSQLSKVEKLTLEPNKVDLFLQAADRKLQEKLEPLLEDKEEDEGLTTKWKNVEDAVGLLTKKERRKDRSNIPKTVQAPKAPSQHEALMEEKRRGNFDDTREGNSFKRQTRGDKAREAASQELPVKDTSASLGEKTMETKDKGKSIAYKLLSDIEAATNLKGVLEERILNAKVEFTLKEVLGIAKKEFHDVIIDNIKRKRQLMGETGMSHAIDARIYKEEDEIDIGYKQPTNERNGYNQRKQKWPIDMEYGWTIRAANNTWGELYGACPDVKIRIGDVATEQHFFVQDTTSYPLILGQPYIMATQMETKVLDDGSAYARRDYGGTKEEVLSRDEGAFDASFIGILENGNIMYKEVDDFKRKERKRLYNIEGQLCKIAPEVTVETRYKTADKKVKPVAGPLPEDSKEQMGEASKEASLRDPMSIGHQFTEETFEELKIGSDGSLLPEEITCFKKVLAKQGRSFAFESYEIGCVDPNIITPMVIFTVPHVP
uniref:Predicted protein n=1 Tax=Physcomitrium patens TaxID=3218 RepID=A9U4T6_PHYPA